jgi:hypothetical protein
MKYYRKNTEIFAFELDGSQDNLITNDMVRLTDDEVYELENPKPSAAELKALRIAELQSLLVGSDYKVLPDYDKPNSDIIEQRRLWRIELRELLEAP